MRKIESLESLSDGKLYDLKDMVKADAGGCDACSACCEDVGDMVELTPYDLYEIRTFTQMTFEAFMDKHGQIHDHNKVGIPHLKMDQGSNKCSFLNDQGRCSVHAHRPGICRLFPLGRVYEDQDLKYFLQVGACVKPKLGKVKVKKWLGIDRYKDNKAFILQWRSFVKALAFRLKFVRDQEEVAKINAYVLEHLFDLPVGGSDDFYTLFADRLTQAKEDLGIL